MSDALPPVPASRGRARLAQAILLGLLGALLGAELAAIEGVAMAIREGLVTPAFDPARRAVMLTSALLFGAVGGLGGLFLPGRWSPKLCLIALGGAAWLLNAHAGWLGLLLGLAVMAALCLWFLRLSPRGRLLCLSADLLLTLGLWATPWDGQNFGSFAEFLGASPQWAAQEGPLSEAELAALPGQRQPNFIVLTIDTLRADHLGCYGAEPSPSPVLDALAGQGARFDAAYAQAPWTRPSVASLFTGLYPASHDVITQYDRLGADLPTLAAMLRGRGYRTACFSANPQVSPAFGFHRGFDQFWNSFSSSAETSAVWALRHRLAAWAFEHIPGLLGRVREAQAGVPGTDAEHVNLAVRSWLDEVGGEAIQQQPLFLYVQYLDPHDPYAAPDDAAAPQDEAFLHAPTSLPPYPLEGSSLPAQPEATREALLAAYDREIHFVDRKLGELLDDLQARGLYQDGDYLIITADHGEEFYDHQQWLHGRSLYQEMVRVPLLMLGPGIGAGAVHDAPVELVDLLPTVAGMSGRPAPFPLVGRDLFPLLVGKEAGSRRTAFSHRPHEAHPIWMLRQGERKLIQIGASADQPLQLAFDLATDPGEQSPVPEAGGAAWEDLRQELAERILHEADLRRGGSVRVALQGAVAKDLQGLGYVGGEHRDPQQ